MCEHRLISIVEFGTATTSHDREVNGEWTHFSKVGGYTDIIVVQCHECGLSRRYKKKNIPKWLTGRMNEYKIIN